MQVATDAKVFGKNLQKITQELEEQLLKRGIPMERLGHLDLRSIKKTGGYELLALPFTNDGKTSCWKVRSVAKSKGGMWWVGDEPERGKHLFNVDCLRDQSLNDYPLIIVEGELDALSFISHGYKRCVSVPNGANMKPISVDDERSSTAFEYLNNASALLHDVKEIIIATDGDHSGRILAEDLAIRLGKARCRWVDYPRQPSDQSEKCKDANEALAAYGPKALGVILEKAKWYPVSGVFKLSELPPIPSAEVMRSGMGNLDQHLGIRLGDFSVVTGIPSMGKSTFVNDLCCRLIERYKIKVAFASLEQPPQTDHKRNLATWYLRRPSGQDCSNLTSQEMNKVVDWIDENMVFIVKDDDEPNDIDAVIERMSACVVQHDVDMIVIDPWNEVDHRREFNQSTTEYVGEAIKKFKRFAKRFGVHVMIVSHPTKISPNQDGSLRVPTLYDIEDSRHWYGKCDVGIVVHRLVDGGRKPSVIRVVKSRYHDILGTTGQVIFDFSPHDGRFTEAEDIEE
tara:strand:- start:563 stop:2098 length:1536 start_codon:yes stop_codon:yes gene_type:complete